MSEAEEDLVAACEERIVNLWPAPTTLMLGDWTVRLANGYSGRANSASALRRGARLSPAELDWVERLFSEAGLPPTVRITDLAHDSVRDMLAERGYRLRDRSIGMIADLPAPQSEPSSGRVAITPTPLRNWLEDVSARQDAAKQSVAGLHAIVGAIRLPAGFATISVDDQAVAFGMAAVDRGYCEIGSIIVDRNRRGEGHGRTVVSALLDWGAKAGAHRAFLQVVAENETALQLYRSFGFRPLYDYDTLSLADSAEA